MGPQSVPSADERWQPFLSKPPRAFRTDHRGNLLVPRSFVPFVVKPLPRSPEQPAHDFAEHIGQPTHPWERGHPCPLTTFNNPLRSNLA